VTTSDETAASRRALNRSLSSSSALINVPNTNPSCTAMVNHVLTPGVVRHSAIMPGAATVALNHGVIPRTIAAASSASCR
jgi:hypothetical protein